MEKMTFFVKIFPFLAFLCAGIFSVLEVFSPSLRSPDFNRWEIDEGTGTTLQVGAWRKVLRPPRVLAQGYMSDGAACVVALVLGAICILVGVAGIRHVVGFPEFLPDVLARF